jgi:hypothetical protein
MSRFVSVSALAAVVVLVPLYACTLTNATGVVDGGADAGTAADGATADGATADADGSDLGECVRYTPAVIAGKKEGSFASRDDVVSVVLPETDVGGGLLKVTYTGKNLPLVGSIVLAEGPRAEEDRFTTRPIGPGATSTPSTVVYYRLHGKKRYQLRTKPFSFDDAGPNGYSIDYTYQPLIDCYEDNDARTSAKRIPVNTTITAFEHAGIETNDSLLVRDSGQDWYWFELPREQRVKLKGFLPGKDGADGANAALFYVTASDGETEPGCATGSRFSTDPVADTENVETCEGILPAGKYFVRLAHFTSQPAGWDADEAIHASWNTPYTFVVEAK